MPSVDFESLTRPISDTDPCGADLDADSHGFLVHVMAQPGGFAELSRTLLRAYAETFTIVQRIRDSCDMADSDADRLQQMHGRLREVSAATENASNGILDTVNRAHVLVAVQLAPRVRVGAQDQRGLIKLEHGFSGWWWSGAYARRG